MIRPRSVGQGQTHLIVVYSQILICKHWLNIIHTLHNYCAVIYACDMYTYVVRRNEVVVITLYVFVRSRGLTSTLRVAVVG